MNLNELTERIRDHHRLATILATNFGQTLDQIEAMSPVEISGRIHLLQSKCAQLYNLVTNLYEYLQRKPNEAPATQPADARLRPGDEPGPS